ncbi:TPA: hypothetical protein ACGSTL_001230 [Vibrio parahaemolyticus]|uniref:hypothetical protein n=1 Tax=Vibrio campbellii TaxID=680 RepID=UPI001F08369A|nr:hypothetical protein [Vibrio campbellii]UMM06648.1 hypothetical protein MKR81_27255 [Vibrio campbellii]
MRAIILRRTSYAVGVFSFCLLVSPLFTSAGFYEITVGVMMLYFLYSIRDINNHFHITWTKVTLKIYPRLELFPPLNRWLVAQDNREITPELYEELAELKGVMESDYIENKIQHVIEYRNGIVTYYDIANIAMMSESLFRLQLINSNE